MRIMSILAFGVVVALGCVVMSSKAQATEVAVVNVDKLFSTSKAGDKARAHLEEVKNVLQAGYDELLESYKGHEDKPEVQGILLDAQRQLNNQMAVEQQAIDSIMTALLAQAVEKWKGSHKEFDMVVSNRVLLDFSDKVDVTDGVSKLLDTLKIEFPPLPNVTVNKPTKE